MRKVPINPRTTAKDLVKMLEETGTKVSIFTVKQVLYPHNLKGRLARQGRSHCSKTTTKKVRLWFATAHGDKDRSFRRNCLWSDKTKLEMFGHNDQCYVWREKGEAREHYPNHKARGWQHHVVGVLGCRRDWCTSQNRWHHEK